jgi:glycosyltransferase involved in cell wall biosynthesis
MRIFTLYYKNQGGGYFKRLCRMIKACAEKGHTVHYIAPKPFAELNNYHRIIWHHAPLPGPPMIKAVIGLVLWPLFIVVIAVRYRIDRFAVFGVPYAAVCGIAALVVRQPIVTFIRSHWIAELQLAGKSAPIITLARIIYYIGSRLSKTVVVNSASLASSVTQNVGRRKAVKILQNNIEEQDIPERYKARTMLANTCGFCEDRFIIGYVGTFKPRKQVWQVIDIFNDVRDTPSVLVLVGDGADRELVFKRMREFSLEDRIHWLGWQPEVGELIAGMDITILPSRFEGSPNAVLESISVGTPVIGAKVMGIEDILPAEMLFPLDNIYKAAKIIRECAINEAAYTAMTTAIENIRERFTFDWDQRIVKIICAP